MEDYLVLKKEIVSWIREYFEKNMPKASAVVGISGGKDSSVTAALCVEALGKERVVGVLMPNGIQSDIDDAKTLVNFLGIAHIVVNIGNTVSTFENTLEQAAAFSDICGRESLSKDSIINLQPRIRMTTLYSIAQSLPNGGLVANTCNRSEDYVGYSTKFGDAAGDFSPLANLTVREVKELGRVMGLPKQLVDKTPSDGLSGQSDEDKLGFTYNTLDDYILTGVCPDEETKKKIDSMHVKNLHKISPMPAFTKKQ